MLTNRELSWLKFNARVLAMSGEARHPLAERLNYLAISASNLDEFFMVRIGSVCDQILAGYHAPDQAGYTPSRTLNEALRAARVQMEEQARMYELLCGLLAREGICREPAPDEADRARLRAYFEKELLPFLTPVRVEAGRAFPLVSGRSLHFIFSLCGAVGTRGYVTMQLPDAALRVIPLARKGRFVLLEDVVRMFAPLCFPDSRVEESVLYRVTRNADLAFDEDEASDLLSEIEKKLRARKWGMAVRLEICGACGASMRTLLQDAFDVDDDRTFSVSAPPNLTFVRQFSKNLGVKLAKYAPFAPRALADTSDMFARITGGDVLLHHPYDSFEPVLALLDQAARDPDVLAIKQTLYRVSEKSPVVSALLEAAKNGKQVTVLFEVKARFDEENNIHWGRKLEQGGCHVIYGLPGLKTHSKITLIIRREQDGIRQYLHLGTGNYNDVTARLYTDLGLLTRNRALGLDATLFFNMLSGYAAAEEMRELSAAPTRLFTDLLAKIDAAAHHAAHGARVEITAKMNALVDPDIIRALYNASSAGVRIRMIIRGICCLRAGIPELSENIQVHSIVGRFLEHSRVFRFVVDDSEELFLSSADWMPRNLHDRVELMFPIKDARLRARIGRILDICLADNVNAWVLRPDGQYEKQTPAPGARAVDAQQLLLEGADDE